MELSTPLRPETASSLGLALVVSSSTPLILLDEQLIVQAASGSFCRSFSVDCGKVVGKELFALGEGEWDVLQLRSLLTATAGGSGAIDAYEMDLVRKGEPTRRLVINAHVVEQSDDKAMRLVVAVTDVTEARQAGRDNAALVQERNVLVQELNHRIANSLQIIASVLMQRVRSVQSEETRTYLRDAHHRVMSIATLQRQLASNVTGDVALRPYFTELCASIGASMISDPALVTLTVEADDSIASAEKSVSMGLIVTELVINALKHAFPDEGARGAIVVAFHEAGGAEGGGWVLSVTDNGIGIVDAERPSEKSGLGTGIVKALAAQLKATVEMTDADPGCRVAIVHR